MRMKKWEKLNLCAGANVIDGAINTDIYPYYEDYCLWDLNKRSKFKSNMFDEINGVNALNYINPKNFIKVMEELHRISKPDGIITLESNSVNSKTSQFLQPFKVHQNDIKIFTDSSWYAHKSKIRFNILENKSSFPIKRFAKKVYWKLEVIK